MHVINKVDYRSYLLKETDSKHGEEREEPCTLFKRYGLKFGLS